MIIKLIRHGESIFNADDAEGRKIPDADRPLTKIGCEQSRLIGSTLGSGFLLKSLIYASPYVRSMQSLTNMMEGAGLFLLPGKLGMTGERLPKIYADVRLREVEHGYDKTKESIEEEEFHRRQHGWFYYRWDRGESPSDCYDRISTFIESLHRQVKRKKINRVLIVSHGLTIRCFVMRWLHLTVDQFCMMHNPKNCDIITITGKDYLKHSQFVSGKWGVSGLRLREKKPLPAMCQIPPARTGVYDGLDIGATIKG